MTELLTRKHAWRVLKAPGGFFRPSNARDHSSASGIRVLQVSRRVAPFMFTILVVAALTGCQQSQYTIPPHLNPWLSNKGVGSPTETAAYYDAIDPTHIKRTLKDWKNANFFGVFPELRAVYFNGGDLQLGRDMHCNTRPFLIACYVTNYGPAPILFFNQGTRNPAWPNVAQALADAVAAATTSSVCAGHCPYAAVAMEAVLTAGGVNVNFYAFADAEFRAPSAVLDSEGEKFVPQMCMVCHGGQYDGTAHVARGASFLPFDVFTFQFSQTSPFRLSDQQEAFRQLNSLVKLTLPNDPIQRLIDDWYKSCGGVNTPGCTPVDYSTSDLPRGWVGSGQVGVDTYFGVVRYYCQTCHVASRTLDLTTYSQFNANANTIRQAVCVSHDMPHAQIPFEHFWSNPLALAALQNFMKSQTPPITSCP